MSVWVMRPTNGATEYVDAVTFSLDHGALLLYDRDVTGLTRLVRAFAPGEWERVWIEGGEG